MSTLDKKYYHNIDLDSNELKSGRIYNVTTSDRATLKTDFLANTPANFKGYIVYDINLNILYTWNGSDWTTAAGGSGTVTSVSASTGMSFTTITGAGSVSIDITKVPYLYGGFSTGFLKYNGSAWVFDNATYLTSAVTSLSATSPITASASTGSVTISTSMSANKLIGRSTTGAGVMEEIALGTGLSFSGTTLNATGASPLTTKGDLFTYNTTNARLPIGSNTQVLIADSSTPTGLKWGSNTAATPTGYYGAWQDNVTQTAAASNTGYAMIFRTIDLSNGVSVVTNGTNLTRITFANTGIYNLQFSSQFQNTHTSDEDVTIWLRFNGIDVTGSAGLVSVPSKHGGVNGHIIAGWNYLLDVVAGQYYELVWSTSNTLVTMEFYAAGSPPPSAASVIMTVTQQSGIMAGTGVTGLGTSGNIQTGTTQTLATGTTGTAFNIASSSNTQTFNIPLASTTSVTAGLISKSDYDTFSGKQAAITGAATTITSSNLTVSKALVSDASGKVAVSTVTDTELGYVSGVTSAIQTQLNSKVSSITFGSTGLFPNSSSFGNITVTGVLNATSGGTGLSSYAIGDIPYASTTTALSKLAAVASGSYLRSAGTSTAPVWSTTTIPNTAVLGDIWYGSASNVITALTGNTTSTRKFLLQTGTGTVSAAPAWDTIAASDISGSALTIGSSDTNITLTTGGTASTALLNAASISVAWAGQLAVGRGGTGASTLTGVVIGAGTTAMTAVSSVSANQLFRVNGTGTGYEFFTPTYLTSVTPHNLLSATHGDTLTDAVVRGDIIIGNSTPKWSRLPFPATAPSGKILQAGPTDVAWSTNPITIGASASVSGSNTGDQTITLSGDVTGSGTGSFGTTIASGVVKLDNMSKIVANSIIGNNTGALATPTVLSGTNVTAMLDIFNGTSKGLVPVSGAGATNSQFLAADGSWLKIGTSAIADQSSKTILANTSPSSGAVSAVAISSITTELSDVVGDSGSTPTKGLVPAPAVGDAAAGKFLKADGLWAVPTTTIGTNVVTNAMLAQVATATFKGRTTPSTGNVEDLTVTQATAMLNLFSTSTTTKGLVPGSNGVGSTYFLRADGTWAVPAGGGGGGGTTTNPLIIKADSGTTEGTDSYTFDGSSAKTINIVAGTNITITKTAGTLTISSTGGSSDNPVTLMTAFLNYT